MRKLTGAAAIFAALFLLGGCEQRPVEVIDIDKVLEIFDRVSRTETGETVEGEERDGKIEPLAEERPDRTKEFLSRFAAELNAAKLISSPVGVSMLASGAIEGFRDENGDGMKGSREPRLFTLEIDGEENRVIATQVVAGETYHRHRSYYHHHYHGGFFGYWMMGSMLSRQNRYYSSPSRRRPDYRSMRMASDGYRSRAVSRARSSRGGARSRGGSRGFSGGK
jgi:hypothetical protein